MKHNREEAQGPLARRWRAAVEREHAQSERARAGVPPPADHWAGLPRSFRQDPRRIGDDQLERLARELSPQDTLLHVGAGRHALPLALRCRSVMAVEPSDSMVEDLQAEAAQAGVANVTVIKATWEDAQAPQADVVLCANVLYTVRDITGFIRKLEAHARRRVLIIVHTEAPLSTLAPLWKPVHGEERLFLPALVDLVPLLWEMGLYPDVEMMPLLPRRGWDTWEEAHQQLRQRLFVTPDSPQHTRLQRAMSELLERVDGRFAIRDSGPVHPALVSWKPERSD
ncbi:MAG: methyltransferase domain-containing protein [Dehalococcoidia bacterium]|nr:methyltransferase domain-containing protein [Dehalococcoidia bacterium]